MRIMEEKPRLLPFGVELIAGPERVAPTKALRRALDNRTADRGGLPHQPAAAVEVLGIPEDQLTPEVLEAVGHLAGEIDRLQRALAIRDGRIAYLENHQDGAAWTPVLDRSGFLTAARQTLERGDAPDGFGLAVFNLRDFTGLNAQHGVEAGDAILHHVADVLAEKAHASDPVGHLGADEFAVLAGNSDADALCRDVDAALTRVPFVYKGAAIAVAVVGVAEPVAHAADLQPALARAERRIDERRLHAIP